MSFDEEDWNRPVMGSGARDTVRERRSTIENNDGVVDRTTYPIQYSSETYKGKFFTRGCRGMLESIQVYCDGDAADTLTIRYSPHPCLGPLGEVSIIPADGYAWQDFAIEEMWNYDSLFIWIYACTANITWGYDAWLPYDGHLSGDVGATWSDLAIRPFFRAVLTGETPGDVPVSGIVNTIRIPNTALEGASTVGVNALSGILTNIVTAFGAGELVQVLVRFDTVVVPAAGVEYEVAILADGLAGIVVGNRQVTQSVIATAGRCALGEFFQDATDTYLWVRLPLGYRRQLQVWARQSTGAPVLVAANIISNALV